MKKILMLYKNFQIGGAESLISNLSENLTDSRVYIGAVFEEEPILKSVELVKFNKMGYSPISVISNLIKIYLFCRKNHIDIIHSHHRYTTFLGNIIAKICNVKLVHTEHNIFPDKQNLNFRGNNIVCVSKSVKYNLLKYNIPENNMNVIYNGINIDDYVLCSKKNLKKELNINDNTFCFGFIGRLEEQKGLFYLLEAFKELVNKEYTCKLVIIGDGSLRNSIIEYVRNNKIEEHVYLTGYRSDIKNIIQSLDVYVLPSIYEGFPMINMEIMVNRKIIIATDVGGNREIITDNENGYIVEPKNPQKILEKMIYVLSEKEQLIIQENNAYKTIVKNFSLFNMCQEYEKYYMSLLSHKSI